MNVQEFCTWIMQLGVSSEPAQKGGYEIKAWL